MNVSFNPMVSNNQYANRNRNKNNTAFKGSLTSDLRENIICARSNEVEQAIANGASKEKIQEIESSYNESLERLGQFAEDRLLLNTVLDAKATDNHSQKIILVNKNSSSSWWGLTKQGTICSMYSENEVVYPLKLNHTQLKTFVDNLTNPSSFDYTCISGRSGRAMTGMVPENRDEKTIEDFKNLLARREAFIEDLKRTNTPKQILDEFIESCHFDKLNNKITELELQLLNQLQKKYKHITPKI